MKHTDFGFDTPYGDGDLKLATDGTTLLDMGMDVQMTAHLRERLDDILTRGGATEMERRTLQKGVESLRALALRAMQGTRRNMQQEEEELNAQYVRDTRAAYEDGRGDGFREGLIRGSELARDQLEYEQERKAAVEALEELFNQAGETIDGQTEVPGPAPQGATCPCGLPLAACDNPDVPGSAAEQGLVAEALNGSGEIQAVMAQFAEDPKGFLERASKGLIPGVTVIAPGRFAGDPSNN